MKEIGPISTSMWQILTSEAADGETSRLWKAY